MAHTDLAARTLAPRFWSSGLWDVLEGMYLTFPTAENTADEAALLAAMSAMVNLLAALPETLPCAACRAHLQRYLAAHDSLKTACTSAEAYGRFLCDLRNDIDGTTVTWEQWSARVRERVANVSRAAQVVQADATPAPPLTPATPLSVVMGTVSPPISSMAAIRRPTASSRTRSFAPTRAGCGSCGGRR